MFSQLSLGCTVCIAKWQEHNSLNCRIDSNQILLNKYTSSLAHFAEVCCIYDSPVFKGADAHCDANKLDLYILLQLLQPFYGPTNFVWDYLNEPLPER